ncbi:MAG: aldehyde dehydrogenase family protein [Vicinamibacterales bacterium]
MASAAAPATDRDLVSVQDARLLARAARQAQTLLAEFSQEQVDRIVDRMAEAARREIESLAKQAVEETGFGVVADKVTKNRFAAETVHAFIQPMKTVGVIRRHDNRKVLEIAEPFGVVAAIVPSTNPTSTAIYKILIAIKARCAIVLSPHPSAVGCIVRTAEIMHAAATAAGLPADAIGWMKTVTLEGTQELMRQREVSVILATGGMGLVRAAYSAGKPAYGVGPGNAPAYIHRSANVPKAVADIITGKTFDNGLLCSSENSVVVDADIAAQVRSAFESRGGYFLKDAEAAALASVLVTPQRLPNPECVGRSAVHIAEKAGIRVPPSTRVLLAPLDGVGRNHPLSIEKLCPVLSFYVVADWRAGCERCKEILRYGGMGHTMSVHSTDDDVILQFGLHKPAFRIVVNTPTTLGSIGLTTGLDPAMTLGCGGYGGNITSDNISPMHLLNIKRLAYETSPVNQAAAVSLPVQAQGEPSTARPVAAPAPAAFAATSLRERIDGFLVARGYTPLAPSPPSAALPGPAASPGATVLPAQPSANTTAPAETEPPVEELDFVAEDDVRRALARGGRIRLKPRGIVTPSARDLASGRSVLLEST